MTVWLFIKFAILPLSIGICIGPISLIKPTWIAKVLRPLAYFLFTASCLELVFSIPTGSVDIENFWRFLVFCLIPGVPILAFWLFRYIKVDWARRGLRFFTGTLLVPVSIFFLFFCLTQIGCVKRSLPLPSPDGTHFALLELISQGALGDDYATVVVRRSWWPAGTVAFSGLGSFDFKSRKIESPQIRWLDDSRLFIRYFDDRVPGGGRGGPATCPQYAAEVQIQCENKR